MERQIKKNRTIMKNRPINDYGTNRGDKQYIRCCDRSAKNKVDMDLAAVYYGLIGWEY